jgi:hypothetical protein
MRPKKKKGNRVITVARGGWTKEGKRAKVRQHPRKIRKRRLRPAKPRSISINPSTIRDFANYLEERYAPQVDFAIEAAERRFERVGRPLVKEKIAEEAVKILIGMGIAIKYPTLAKFAILVFLG